MLEKIAVVAIIFFCAALLARRFYRQWRAFSDKNTPTCTPSCCACDDATCCLPKNDR